MPELAVVVALAFVLYFFTVIRPTGVLNANSLFVYIQTIMALGTFRLLDPRIEADALYGDITAWAVVSYMAVSPVVLLHRPRVLRVAGTWVPPLRPVMTFTPKATTWAFVALSVLIVIGYYRSVPASALVEGIRNTLSGGDADIAGIRLAAYAGDQYFFPGYVNQFKNALLPALVAVILTYWVRMQQRRRLTALMLLAFTTFGLVGAGQRGAFVQAVVAVAVYLFLLHGQRFPRGLVKAMLPVLAVLVAVSVALGRGTAGLGRGAGVTDYAVGALADLVDRIFEQQQNAGIAAFRYIYTQPIQWGAEWMQALTGVLPGAGGTDLPGRVFAMVYGSDRGTIPPSIWGSIYHNFGLVGVFVMPALLAVTIAGVTRLGALDRERNTLELMGIAGVTTTIGFWAAGDPVTMLNTGLVMYASLWFLGTNHTRLAARRSARLSARSARRSPRRWSSAPTS